MGAPGPTTPVLQASFSLRGDPGRVLRAIATNQLARFAPTAYIRLTGQTGRGAAAEEAPGDIAQYFRDCVDAYFQHMGVAPSDVRSYLAGKTILEYGPGDLPGVAALMVARGAQKVYCVDRFPLVNLSPKNAKVVTQLIDGCSGDERARLTACLSNPDNPAAGFTRERIEYLVRPSGLSGMSNAIDLIISRAVLEHVDDLDATFDDMVRAMKPGALAIHQVDLRSHGLHRSNPLDFLAWSPTLWSLMYSEKGVPNRWRVDKYRSIVSGLRVEVVEFAATKLAETAHVRAVRSVLAPTFKLVSDEALSWLGFWLVLRKRVA